METNKNIPYNATHPTEIIKDEIKSRGISQKELALRMGLKPSNLSRLLKGENITPAIASRLEDALDIPADLWLRLQAQYNRDIKDIALRDEKEKEAIALECMLSNLLNLSDLYRRLNINSAHFIQHKLHILKELLKFDPIEIGKMQFVQEAFYKKSDRLNTDGLNQNTWLTLAYIESVRNASENTYEKGQAEQAAKIISHKVHNGEITEDIIKDILNQHGITYSVVKKLDKTPIDAAALKVEGKPAIITTHRYNDMSRLIFNILHELCHVEYHMFSGNNNVFISSDATYSCDNKMEQEANTFAENMLISKELWKNLMSSAVNNISSRNIVKKLKALSHEYNLNFNIVMWRYKHESRNYGLYGVKTMPIR